MLKANSKFRLHLNVGLPVVHPQHIHLGIFSHIRTVEHLDIIKVLYIHQLMHQ